jgi:hypothetical protein
MLKIIKNELNCNVTIKNVHLNVSNDFKLIKLENISCGIH